MSEFPGIDRLPAVLGELARQYRTAGETLARSNPGSLLSSSLPLSRMLTLVGAGIRTRFFLAVHGERVVFFFRRDSPARVVMDTNIAFRIEPCDADRQSRRMLPDGIVHFVVCPPFVDAVTSAGPFADVMQVPSSEVLLLRLPEGSLAVARPGADMRAAWRPVRTTTIRPITIASPESFELVLSLAECIGQWVSSRFEAGEAIPLDIAGMARRAPILHDIFHCICEAWTESWNETTTAAPDAWTPAAEIRDYNASVVLRLRPDGSVARDDDGDPFQLTLTVGIGMVDGVPQSRIVVTPPGFLASGPLHNAMLVALNSDDGASEAAARLGIAWQDDFIRLRTFLLSALPTALVLRMRTGGEESALVIYSSIVEGCRRALVLSSRFEIGEGDRVGWVPDSIRIVHSSLPFGTPPLPQPDLVRYCLRLLAALRDWVGVLR